jgi:DNA-binding GntR family transcriptional regulator
LPERCEAHLGFLDNLGAGYKDLKLSSQYKINFTPYNYLSLDVTALCGIDVVMLKPRKPSATLANAAYERLRADLLACRIFPGDPIKINEISAVLQTNPIAIREALSKLSAEGLVTSEAQKGFRAAQVSVDDLLDLTNTRIEIECLCVKSSISLGNVDWETGIVGALHRLLRTPERAPGDEHRNSDEWALQHAKFHEALVGSCESKLMLGIRSTLYAQSERYRRLSIPLAEFDRDVAGEHRGLAEAVMARDLSAAAALMKEHLQTTTDILLKNKILFERPERSECISDMTAAE